MSYPLHYEDARPMYTTIDTEYLEQLQSAKKAVESIKEDHLKLIVNSLTKAKTKHPHFCDKITLWSVEYYKNTENTLKNINDNACAGGCSSAEMILEEEIVEMFHSYKQGNKQEAMEECADAIAVLVRIMEELDG